MSDESHKPSHPGDRAVKFGELTVRVPEELAPGVFANFAMVNHNPDEFTVDFTFVEPGGRQGVLRSRVILTPPHFKRLVAAMAANLSRYERAFGEIQERGTPQNPPAEQGPIN